MKWTASVVTVISIVSIAALTSVAKGESRALVSQNEALDDELDSPSLFLSPKATKVKPAAKAAPEPMEELVAAPDIVAETKKSTPKPTAKKAVVKPTVVRAKPVKQVSIDEIDLDEEDETPAKRPVKRPSRKPAAEVPTTVVIEKRDPKIEAKIDEALVLEGKKEYRKVIDLLQPFADQLSRRGLMTLARAGKGAGDTAIEIKTLQLGLAKNPNDYVTQTQLGEVFSRLKRPSDAIAAFQAAIALNKRFEPAYEGLWTELEKGREYYEARSVLSDMMQLFGNKPKFYSALCRLFSFDDYLEKATEMCQAAIEKDPKHADNYVHLAVSLRDQEGGAEAQKVLARAAKRFPASESVQTTTGSIYLDKKDYAVAYRYYKQATKADPKSTRAWQGLANTAFELQKNDEALEAFGKACAIDRKMTKDLRIAISKLRSRKDTQWESQYEARLLKCD
ncbi:MAG: tetratricopeptide repeat protein [Bdellovibrionota bacterium]